MRNLFKLASIALLAFAALAPVALARKQKIIVKKYYKPGEGTVYFVKGGDDTTKTVYTVTETTPATTVTDMGGLKITYPATEKTTTSVYVNGQLVGESTKVKELGLEEGTYKVELRDSEGKTIWVDPSLHVVKKQTTIVYPQ
jgi:hypothetical protein